MNTEKLSPAMTKAIEDGGTKNVVIGNALVKRGIFEKTETGIFPFMPTAEFLGVDEAMEAHPEPHITLSAGEPLEADADGFTDGSRAGSPHEVEEYVVELDENPAVAAAMVIETAESTIQAVKELPAPTFTLTEEQIEANAAEKLALTIQRDEEAYRGIATVDMTAAVLSEIAWCVSEVAKFNLPKADQEKMDFDFETARKYLEAGDDREARRLAHRKVEDAARIVRLRNEWSVDLPEWRKDKIRTALASYGTVVYPEGTPEHADYSEKLTEALAEWKETVVDTGVLSAAKALVDPMPKAWRITFERIGRHSNPKPFDYLSTDAPDAFMTRLRKYVGKFLTSREFEVAFDANTLLIDGGRFGKGTAAPIEE